MKVSRVSVDFLVAVALGFVQHGGSSELSVLALCNVRSLLDKMRRVVGVQEQAESPKLMASLSQEPDDLPLVSLRRWPFSTMLRETHCVRKVVPVAGHRVTDPWLGTIFRGMVPQSAVA